MLGAGAADAGLSRRGGKRGDRVGYRVRLGWLDGLQNGGHGSVLPGSVLEDRVLAALYAALTA